MYHEADYEMEQLLFSIAGIMHFSGTLRLSNIDETFSKR